VTLTVDALGRVLSPDLSIDVGLQRLGQHPPRAAADLVN
jgi:hypothetical protein